MFSENKSLISCRLISSRFYDINTVQIIIKMNKLTCNLICYIMLTILISKYLINSTRLQMFVYTSGTRVKLQFDTCRLIA